MLDLTLLLALDNRGLAAVTGRHFKCVHMTWQSFSYSRWEKHHDEPQEPAGLGMDVVQP